MSSSRPKTLPAIGFLTVREHAEHGLFGGYLVLNAVGRPLEFHCTVPVKANRAQEILYGPTLKSFLYSEQIGQTLVSKAKSEPIIVCTDVELALGTREFCSPPVVLVVGRPASAPAETAPSSAAPSSKLRQFALGKNALAIDVDDDPQRIIDLWGPFADELDLLEPFGRIRDAIDEAHGTART